MPVLTKEKLNILKIELNNRFSILLDAISPRELKNAREGTGNRNHWINPENMAATMADNTHLRLAIEDFKNILAEIKRLK